MSQPNSDDYIDKALKENKGKSQSDIERLEELRKKKKENKDALNSKIRAILLYSGFIGAIISAVSYLIATIVMINGVSADLTMQNQVLFSVLGAVVGLLISFMLRSQGVIYAKQNEEVAQIMSEYIQEETESKSYEKNHTIVWYMGWATVVDFFLKGVSVAVSTYFVVYIFTEGNGNWGLLWLAISNIGLFTSFGLRGLAKMYDNYIEKHIPAVIARTKELKRKREEKEKHSN